LLAQGPLRPIATACALSAALLGLLHLWRAKIRPVSLRAAADLCLLTPLPLLVLLKFLRR
jgi:hypothetical protein